MDSAKANYQDIDLILKLYELHREATMLQAGSYVGGNHADVLNSSQHSQAIEPFRFISTHFAKSYINFPRNSCAMPWAMLPFLVEHRAAPRPLERFLQEAFNRKGR
jgi:hypothetical protein